MYSAPPAEQTPPLAQGLKAQDAGSVAIHEYTCVQESKHEKLCKQRDEKLIEIELCETFATTLKSGLTNNILIACYNYIEISTN